MIHTFVPLVYNVSVFFLASFIVFSLSLDPRNLSMMSSWFYFMVPEVHWVSWIIQFGKSVAIITSNNFSAPLFYSPLIFYLYVLQLILSHSSFIVLLFHFSMFLFGECVFKYTNL